MKIITVVGIRKSGKTGTVTALIEAIRRRGKRVGTCKTVFCPTFSIDTPTSNTARHMRAGAQLVCARARHETALIRPQAMALSEVLRAYAGFDYVLLEGDYLSPVPRLVAAHTDADALPRLNEQTLAFVGRISTRTDIALPLPRFNALEEADALLDFIDRHVPDMQPSPALDTPLPPVPGVTDDGFCQCGCHHHQQKQGDVQVTVGGRALSLTEEQRAQVLAWAGEARP
ncbi:MAG TPA: molybdopterin-guanine dinucleotide biosynthesis protein MobB [Candidatus Ventricola intestinavium]|nr:molybdopterin-guanine dinucleotide biosynthesis protein MobB [Candidatus Ventricola intestinavium]